MEACDLYNESLKRISKLTDEEVSVSIDTKDTFVDKGLEKIIESINSYTS